MNPGLTLLACVLGFFFSFLCVQIGAVTDQTPLTAASKASQLVFGGATAGHNFSIQHAQKLNLVAGGIASGMSQVFRALVPLWYCLGFGLSAMPYSSWDILL